MLRRLLFLLIPLFPLWLPAQQSDRDMTADDYLSFGDYNRALAALLKIYPKQSDDIAVNYKIGFCYLHVNDDRSKAIPYLQRVYKKDGSYKDICLLMGQAYMYHHEFDAAIGYFNQHRNKTTAKNYDETDHFIRNCEDAKTLIRNPVDVSFENLGKEVNSKYPDYYPFVSQDGSTIYYTTRREGGSSRTRSWGGYSTADVYSSKLKNGQWSKGKSLGPAVNTSGDEECVGVTADGKNMILYCDNALFVSDIYLSSMGKGKSFPRPVEFPAPVNSEETEWEGSMTNDGEMIVVVSDRKGGTGGHDIWIIRKLPGGSWGAPFNPGPNINTKYDEAFPVFDEETNTLYFASQGHVNMGGYDIFRSKYDPVKNSFGPAENLGYPINNTMDNMEFTLAANHRDGYISAVRPEGLGDLDIYRVIFNRVEQRLSVLTGTVFCSDSVQPAEEFYVVLKNSAGERIDSARVNQKSQRYVMAVAPGKYTLVAELPGYDPLSLPLMVFDRSDFIFEISRNLTLQKKGIAPAAPPPKK